jgi:hypothetical protein
MLEICGREEARLMLLNFLTAMAWIWGGFFAFLFAAAPFCGIDNERQARGWLVCGLCGLPAWAWLIARYWM